MPAGTQSNTLVLLGAGIQENSWNPVVRALQATIYPEVLTDDAANTALAQLVYMMRFCKDAEARETAQFGTPRQHVVDSVALWKAAYERTCAAICEEIQESESRGEISLRENFETVWNRFIMGPGGHCFVTTNWDRTFANEVAGRWPDTDEDTVHHLHGDRRDPASLLLPTEVAADSYKSSAQCSAIAQRRNAIMQAMGQATRVVIYGLALSPLDIELCSVITAGIDSGNVKEVCILDPNHAVVAARLRVLLRAKMPAFATCDPRTL